MAGIVIEQHSDRARLFMQWHQFEWSVGWDPFDALRFGVVPVVALLDRRLVVQAVNPNPEEVAQFADLVADPGRYDNEVGKEPVAVGPPPTSEAQNGQASLESARTLALWGGEERIDDAVELIDAVTGSADKSDQGDASFAAGVIYRMRYDSIHRVRGDFEKAIGHWRDALDADPNNYVRRRRLQQYGPLSKKPYAFYDWVATAQREIADRGDQPVTLSAPLSQSEIAEPRNKRIAEKHSEPDPDGVIDMDAGLMIEVDTAVIPPKIGPGEPARVHLEFRPSDEEDIHWNNEVDPMILWVEPPIGWEIEDQYLVSHMPSEVLSIEPRHIEFDIRAPMEISEPKYVLRAYALYYICAGADGTCLYRRQDLELWIERT